MDKLMKEIREVVLEMLSS